MNSQEYIYTIEDIATLCEVSKQSIYNLSRKNKDIINNNSKKQGRRMMYNQDAVNFCLNYYGKDKLIKDNKQDTVNFNNELQDEIKALQAEIATLKQTLEDTEAERKALLQQNGALILTLQQEKQEKMLLLPAPRKGIKETIRGWFQKEK